MDEKEMAEKYKGTIWEKWSTNLELFEMNDESITDLMNQIRQMPSGIGHYWFINNPNGDKRKRWTHIGIWATRPVYLEITLRSNRLKFPGDPICGEQNLSERFHDLGKAERYLRRWIRKLQRTWQGVNPDADNKAELERREQLWRTT